MSRKIDGCVLVFNINKIISLNLNKLTFLLMLSKVIVLLGLRTVPSSEIQEVSRSGTSVEFKKYESNSARHLIEIVFART